MEARDPSEAKTRGQFREAVHRVHRSAGSRTVALLVTLLALAAAGGAGSVTAQEAQADVATEAAERVRVFLDCQTRGCDFDHFRREIRFVDWVRDRADSDVHLLITSQRSAAGRVYTLSYIGRARFQDDDATLTFGSSDTDTGDERRAGLTQRIELGLVRYASQTQTADQIAVEYRDAGGQADQLTDGQEETDDPWNYWVYRINGGGQYRGESQQRGTSLFGSLSADRTTEELKVRFSASLYYQEDQFDFEDETLTSIVRENSASAYGVYGIGAHFAAGARVDIWSSEFSNIEVASRVAAAFEYSIFPYVESTRRELTLAYTLGMNGLNYIERTIFDRLSQLAPDHALVLSLDLRQPWGDARVAMTGRQFLHEPDLYSISARAGIDVRLFRGLSLDVSGSYQAVRDQISLRAGEASPEDILLFRRELATDFRFRTELGLTYRFGSIFNNAVNPRLSNFDRPF